HRRTERLDLIAGLGAAQNHIEWSTQIAARPREHMLNHGLLLSRHLFPCGCRESSAHQPESLQVRRILLCEHQPGASKEDRESHGASLFKRLQQSFISNGPNFNRSFRSAEQNRILHRTTDYVARGEHRMKGLLLP